MAPIPKARFTRHGHIRVVGSEDEERRLELSQEEVAKILDGDLAIPVGTDRGRIHRAFYSPADDDCFIAVQDRVTGDVVTILPFSHHGRWVLDVVQVRKMAMELGGYETRLSRAAKLPVVAGPDAKCVVSMEVRRPTDEPGKTRIGRLRDMSRPVTEGSLLHEVVQNLEWREEIEMRAMAKLNWSHPNGSEIVGYKVRFVSRGEPSDFRWFEKDWTPRVHQDR